MAASGREPRIEAFTGERRFADSHRAAEHVAFRLPRQQLLFAGDLGRFEGSEGLRGGGVRARGLPAQTLLQSWPAAHGPATLPMERFRALLAP